MLIHEVEILLILLIIEQDLSMVFFDLGGHVKTFRVGGPLQITETLAHTLVLHIDVPSQAHFTLHRALHLHHFVHELFQCRLNCDHISFFFVIYARNQLAVLFL